MELAHDIKRFYLQFYVQRDFYCEIMRDNKVEVVKKINSRKVFRVRIFAELRGIKFTTIKMLRH